MLIKSGVIVYKEIKVIVSRRLAGCQGHTSWTS